MTQHNTKAAHQPKEVFSGETKQGVHRASQGGWHMTSLFSHEVTWH